MKKVLFIDRDGTLVIEPPVDKQLDAFEKLEFFPGAINGLKQIVDVFDYELVMVTNQDGLGTDSFPSDTFWPVQNFIIKTFEQEGISFSEVLIDGSLPSEQSENRKPGIGMMGKYLYGNYDLENSFVIGDRESDMNFAKNLGAKGIWLQENIDNKSDNSMVSIDTDISLVTKKWCDIFSYLKKENGKDRVASIERITNETKINIEVNLDAGYQSKIETGLGFFDHMLDQIAKHAEIGLIVQVDGDLEIDEHHTIEDTALALGEGFLSALGNKRGIERYGYCLPMDDCLAQVALDFGGRPWCVWDANFNREKIGDVPCELFFHFFKSFSDTAKCNLNIHAKGDNEHHKIESIFKAFARSIKQAVKRDLNSSELPSTKGVL